MSAGSKTTCRTPVGIGGLLALYYLNYKPFNRFVMYENGFYKRFTKEIIDFSNIDYFVIDNYRYQPPCLNIHYNGRLHEWYPRMPKQDIKKIKKIFTEKGIPEKK